jgi:hypothetical protein
MARHILDPCPGPLPGRFRVENHAGGGLAVDALTGLVWTLDANPLGFPLTWTEALAAVAGMNAENALGRGDWRVPNRRELRSIVDHGRRNPALPEGHPFQNVFLGWRWTSTSKAGLENYAWNLHLEGGRLFYSRKDEARLLWPCAGGGDVLPRTGQMACFGADGGRVDCAGSGQDGALRLGAPWPEPRFERKGTQVLDRLTGLAWLAPDLLPNMLSAELRDWEGALALAEALGDGWRLPDINELESLVDAALAGPALPEGLPGRMSMTAEGLWSATTSGFDAAWAFVLYVQKGAVGVGFKAGREFRAWPVRARG